MTLGAVRTASLVIASALGVAIVGAALADDRERFEQTTTSSQQSRTEWIAKVLEEIETIEEGMTRHFRCLTKRVAFPR